MCGRYITISPTNIISKRFDVSIESGEFSPSYNVAPTQSVPGIIHSSERRELKWLKWGLIPSWAKDPTIGSRMINARAETLREKQSFRTAFKKSRCLLVTDGFYEWKKEGKTKTPHLIRLISQEPFVFAGLWESWINPEGTTIESCTIITTEPNDLMKPIHNRMPVILDAENETLWLDPKVHDTSVLEPLLKSYPADKMETYPVSSFVNSPRNNGPECIVQVSNDDGLFTSEGL